MQNAVIGLIAVGLCAIWCVPAMGEAKAGSKQQRWYVVRLQGAHSGWMLESVETSEGRVTTDSQMHLVMRRGDLRIEMDFGTRFVETAEGRPIRASVRQKLASQAVEKEIEFLADGLRVTERQGGGETVRDLPAIGDEWLTPVEAARRVEQELGEGKKVIRYRTFDPAVGLEPYDVEIEVVGQRDIEVFGRVVPAQETRMMVLEGVVMTSFTDAQGLMLKSTMPIGGMELEIVAADEQLAKAEVDPPELMNRSLVKPSFTLLRPREQQRAAYRLSIPEGRMPDLPHTTAQTWRRIDEGTIELTVDVGGVDDGDGEAGEAEAPAVMHTAMIDGRDARIVELAKQATAGGAGQRERDGADAPGRLHGARRAAGGAAAGGRDCGALRERAGVRRSLRRAARHFRVPHVDAGVADGCGGQGAVGRSRRDDARRCGV